MNHREGDLRGSASGNDAEHVDVAASGGDTARVEVNRRARDSAFNVRCSGILIVKRETRRRRALDPRGSRDNVTMHNNAVGSEGHSEREPVGNKQGADDEDETPSLDARVGFSVPRV